MSRLHASFALGYHGCDAAVAEQIVSGRAPMRRSDRVYDWLGSGIYFWEADPQRALEWAGEKVARGAYRQAAVVGAVIDLGECLNLLSRDAVELLKQAYTEFAHEIEITNETMPENGSLGPDPDDDRVLRRLDRAVIEHLHTMMARGGTSFDTVRGVFREGPTIYPGAGFREKTHVQLAVRNPACIKGMFHPR